MTYDLLYEPLFCIALTLSIGILIGIISSTICIVKENKALKKELDAKNKRDNKFLSDEV